MSAKHKSATEVTIASTEEQGALHEFVQRYWRLVVGLVLGLAIVSVLVQYRSEQSATASSESWIQLGTESGLTLSSPAPMATAVTLGDVSEELSDTIAGPWAKALEIGKRLEGEDFEGAQRAAQELEAGWPDHPLVTLPLFQDDGSARTLRSQIDARTAALAAWEKAHPELFQNPPLPEGAPRVRFNTAAGSIVIGLYEEFAPQHAENFLKLCGEGFYDGISFHRVLPNAIQGGDPNSRDLDKPETWGLGGPGYTIEPEMGSLWHFRGAVSAAATAAAGPTSGSQFFIVTEDSSQWDGSYSVFGVVLEGMDVAEAIGSAPVLGDRPEEPVVIESTEVL